MKTKLSIVSVVMCLLMAFAMRDAWAQTPRAADTGRGGSTWLHRWALTAGKRGAFFAGKPETPAFVMKEAGINEP